MKSNINFEEAFIIVISALSNTGIGLLEIANINETDVFVQQLDESAVRQTTWDKVSNLSGQTLLYNNLGSLYSKI